MNICYVVFFFYLLDDREAISDEFSGAYPASDTMVDLIKSTSFVIMKEVRTVKYMHVMWL